jgi:hypothetical protein
LSGSPDHTRPAPVRLRHRISVRPQ